MWSKYAGGYNGDYHLIYLGEYQPTRVVLWLKPDDAYQFDVIDTWDNDDHTSEGQPAPSSAALQLLLGRPSTKLRNRIAGQTASGAT